VQLNTRTACCCDELRGSLINYKHTRWKNGTFGREITIHTVQIYDSGRTYFRQGNHDTYGHIRCRYMVLANLS